MSVLTDYTGLARERFVETGTYEGNSLMHARHHFKECLSVELDSHTYARTRQRFLGITNVHLHLDHSPKFLREVLDHRIPTTFWLDAHWDGKDLPFRTQCPLLDELLEIERLNWRVPPIILIDDVRLFTGEEFARQPGRWKEDEWPALEEIEAALPDYHWRIIGTDVDPILRYDHD